MSDLKYFFIYHEYIPINRIKLAKIFDIAKFEAKKDYTKLIFGAMAKNMI